MPDSTITGLPSATLPLNGSGLIPMDQAGATVSAGSFTFGQPYRITALGTTNFTLIGAAANELDLIFTATGAGAGTGAAVVMTTVKATVQDIANLASPPLYAATTTYTASGAITTTDRMAIINAASAVTMTLASGSSNGQSLLIKRVGAGAVTVTASLDGNSDSIVADSTTIKESVLLSWSSSLSTWLIL